MTGTVDAIATRDDIEGALWRWSEWRADQRGVDEVMALIDRYAEAVSPGAERAADAVLAHARREAEQIVQSARDEAAVLRIDQATPPQPPSTALVELDPTNVTTAVWQDARGAVWVRLVVDPKVTGQTTATCTGCGVSKALLMFRPDSSTPNGRRGQCRDCENAKRRARRIKSNKWS